MSLELPDYLSRKVRTFPEYRMGIYKVKFVLKDGAEVSDVYIANNTIAKVGGRAIKHSNDLDFNIEDIANVSSEV